MPSKILNEKWGLFFAPDVTAIKYIDYWEKGFDVNGVITLCKNKAGDAAGCAMCAKMSQGGMSHCGKCAKCKEKVEIKEGLENVPAEIEAEHKAHHKPKFYSSTIFPSKL